MGVLCDFRRDFRPKSVLGITANNDMGEQGRISAFLLIWFSLLTPLLHGGIGKDPFCRSNFGLVSVSRVVLLHY